MEITQAAHNKENAFSRSPQVKSDPADDFGRYIDTENSDRSDYEVREAREADRYDDDYYDDDVDAASETDRTEPEEKASAKNPSEEAPGEAVPANITDIVKSVAANGDQGTSADATRTAVNPSQQANEGDTNSKITNGDTGTAQAAAQNGNSNKTANPNAATPAEAAQAAVNNGPASEAAKGRLTGAEAIAAATNADASPKQKTPVAAASDKKVETTVQQTTAAQQTAAIQPGKTSKQQTEQSGGTEQASNGLQKSAPTSLEKMRADELSSMSEKDTLSQKLSELLNAAKGKIVGIQPQTNGPANGNTAASGMASAQNLMQAANGTPANQVTPPPTSTAVGTVAQNVAQADIPIIIPTADATATVVPQTTSTGTDLSQAGTLATTTGAATGIDSTSSSSSSQASLASRAAAQAGSPAEQVSTQLINAAKDGNEKIKVQLHPAELGRVDIKLEISQDGRVMAVIAADNQESLDLLQQDSKALEQALKDAGFDTDQNSLNFSLNQDPDGNEQMASAGGENASTEAEEEITLETQLAALSAQNATSSGLNIKV